MRERNTHSCVIHWGEPFHFVLTFKVQKIKHWSSVLRPTSPSQIDFLTLAEKIPSIYWLSFHTLTSVMYGAVTARTKSSCIPGSSCFTTWQKRVIIASFLPAPVLALQSDVRPNYFTYLMYCHRLDGNRHPLLTLCTTWPLCLLTADISDAAGGILSSALGLLTCHFKDSAAVSGWKWKRTLADVHVLWLSEIKVFCSSWSVTTEL